MTFTSPIASSGGSPSPSLASDTQSRPPSPSSEALSVNPSPSSQSSSLAPMATFAASEEPDKSPSSGLSLTRTIPSSRGGCWTCRLRRKKCDEQRRPEDDSCMTCSRLNIQCLGWGIRRPDWMRDKDQVEEYKAMIKAKLTRAGLIRGQPRPPSGIPHAGATRGTASRARGVRRNPDFTMPDTTRDPEFQYLASPSGINRSQTVQPAMNSNLRMLPAASHSDPSVNTLGLNLSASDDLPFDFSAFGPSEINSPVPRYQGDFEPQNIQPTVDETGPNSMQQIEHVTYYFNYVARLQYPFGGNTLSNITYSIIVQEPRGAVTNAVCALASLHWSRMQVAGGFELPNANPQHSFAHYFYQEAILHLRSKQIAGSYTGSDAIAALHLVSYSLFCNGSLDWHEPLSLACEWLAQTGIIVDPTPKLALLNMSTIERAALKTTLWFDIFATLPLMRQPKYLAFYRRLLGETNTPNAFWPNLSQGTPSEMLHMETICGCPDNAMLAFAEVSALANWKMAELRNRSLSYPELIRRGTAVEQLLRQSPVEPLQFSEFEQTPLHPGSDSTGKIPSFPTEETRRIVAALFQEAVILYLHTILSEAQPRVPEIVSSVEQIIKLFNQLLPSEVDRSLTFVISIAGCMTDSSVQRDFFKARLQGQDDSFGNLLQTRAVMEAVWQRRDTNGGFVDWREVMRERGLGVLLV